jgi:TBC1 domain family member 8/9
VELQRGQMKAVKSFVQTCYSEVLIASANETDGKEKSDALPGNDPNSMYLGGLGLKFKFPGDPRK